MMLSCEDRFDALTTVKMTMKQKMMKIKLVKSLIWMLIPLFCKPDVGC